MTPNNMESDVKHANGAQIERSSTTPRGIYFDPQCHISINKHMTRNKTNHP